MRLTKVHNLMARVPPAVARIADDFLLRAPFQAE